MWLAFLAPRMSLAAAPDTPAAARPAWDFAALPIGYYAPETSLGLGAIAMMFSNAPSPPERPRRDDQLSVLVTGTLRSQFAVGGEAIKYWRDARHRLSVESVAMRFPNRFWGVGNDTPEDAMDVYTKSLVAAKLGFGTRIVEEIYVGVTAGVGWYRTDDFAADGAVAQFLATNLRGGRITGGGPFVWRDTRDDAMWPRHGSLTTATALVALRAVGSDYSYGSYEVDHRHYLAVGARSVLAFEVFGRNVRGDVPLDDLPVLGGAARLRGYYEGRFRDRVYLMTQLEWRLFVAWRLTVVPFGAVGNVFPDLGAVTASNPKAAGGLGLRINLKKDRTLHVRVDAAKSSISSGLYVNLGEAF